MHVYRKGPQQESPPCVLIRESFRDEGKVHKRTLANISHLPDEIINQIGKLFNGGSVIDNPKDNFQIIRSLPYTNVKVVLSTFRQIGLDKVISYSPQRKYYNNS